VKLARATTPAAMRRLSQKLRARGRRLGFVPTMGALHAGHLSLVRLAARDADRVVVSIFVNPLQFGPQEDLAHYPRDLEGDLQRLAGESVDAVYLPSPETMYPDGFATRVTVGGLDSVLEGARRPGHFSGVCTVVLKLLDAVTPDVLWLGQKDAQQCAVLERLVRDLDLPVKVKRGATMREGDGLAMSSRNAYLTPEERAQAPVLYQALSRLRAAARAGEREAAVLRELAARHIAGAPLARLESLDLVDARTLVPLERLAGEVLVLVVCRFGAARLIDNVQFRVLPGGGGR
jgi:pantoate--beta-alanine ligase